VDPEIEKYQALLEHLLSLLRALAEHLVGCRKEFVARDLDGIYRCIATQEELCRQVQSIRPAIDASRRICTEQLARAPLGVAGMPDGVVRMDRLRGTIRELAKAQAEVGRLNQIHAAYLRRCGRTVRVLMNFVGSYSLTYARPSEPMLAAPQSARKG
jgi:hypothetical protein